MWEEIYQITNIYPNKHCIYHISLYHCTSFITYTYTVYIYPIYTSETANDRRSCSICSMPLNLNPKSFPMISQCWPPPAGLFPPRTNVAQALPQGHGLWSAPNSVGNPDRYLGTDSRSRTQAWQDCLSNFVDCITKKHLKNLKNSCRWPLLSNLEISQNVLFIFIFLLFLLFFLLLFFFLFFFFLFFFLLLFFFCPFDQFCSILNWPSVDRL